MRADALAHTQLMMAQSIELLANHIEQSTGYQLTPVTYAELPIDPKTGMIGVVTDGKVTTGGVVQGGGTQLLMVLFGGTYWRYAAGDTKGVMPLQSITFSQLPSPPVQGMLACISDSNRNSYGQTITAGGGPYLVLAFYDGANWVVK